MTRAQTRDSLRLCNKIFFSNIMKQKKEYDDSWRWTADLIVKYAPENYDERGIYRKDEWVALSDIGNVYDGKRFTRKSIWRRKINTYRR